MILPIQFEGFARFSHSGQADFTGIKPALPIFFGTPTKKECTCIQIGGGAKTCYKRGSDTEKRTCKVSETTKQCCDALWAGKPSPFPAFGWFIV